MKVSSDLVLELGEEFFEASRQPEDWHLAGHRLAHDEQNTLEPFIRQQHFIFLVSLRASKPREEGDPSCSPGSRARRPKSNTLGINCNPFHQCRAKGSYFRRGSYEETRNGGRIFNRQSCLGSESSNGCHNDTLLEAHGKVFFLEQALDFKSYTERPLPATPQTRCRSREMQKKEAACGWRSVYCEAGFTNTCGSIVLLGAATKVGVNGRPVFT